MSGDRVTTGLEVLVRDGSPVLNGKRVGLITNHSAIDRQLQSAIDILHASTHFELAALFGPEHGVRGQAQAGVVVGSSVDEQTGLPVYSLYGDTRSPTAEMLEGLDALLFDIQDVPVRFATYVSTLACAQEAAADIGLPFVVCDRPNSLTGVHVEGNVLDPSFASFVGVHPVSIRHGMTIGELARLFAADNAWPEPTIIKMEGWRRSLWYDQTGLPWVLPSPNLPTLDSLLVYPGACFIEGTNLSEGRGTTRPFEFIGAPWIDPFKLARELTQRELPGVGFRAAYFEPTFSKHAKTTCGGIQIHVFDRALFRPVELGVHLVDACRTLSGDSFEWRSDVVGGYAIDLLSGSSTLRLGLESGMTPGEIVAQWDEEAAGFKERAKEFWMYEV